MTTLTLNKVPDHLLLKRKAEFEQRKREEEAKKIFKSEKIPEKTKVTPHLNSASKKENENISVGLRE